MLQVQAGQLILRGYQRYLGDCCLAVLLSPQLYGAESSDRQKLRPYVVGAAFQQQSETIRVEMPELI
jgi:hypothetical protein